MPDISDIKSFLYYDLDTGIFTWIKHHFKNLVGKRAGRTNSNGYRQISINDKMYYEHILAVFYVTGKWPENDVDHKDRVRSNNKWLNLRPATKTQNNHNIIVRKNNKLGIKGVSKIAKNGKYKSTNKNKWKSYFIGNTFDNPEEAGKIYEAKAKKKFTVNFIIMENRLPDIRTVLNALDAEDKRLWTQHRTEMRRSYLTAHNSILGVGTWSDSDDTFLDYIDIKLALLFDKAGGMRQQLDTIIVSTDDAKKIEQTLDKAEDAKGWEAKLKQLGANGK